LFTREVLPPVQKTFEIVGSAFVEILISGDLNHEIEALDVKGGSSFQLLQSLDMGQEKPPIVYYAFDSLRLNGKDLQGLTNRRMEGKAGRTAEKASGCDQVFSLLHEKHLRASRTGCRTWAGRVDW
jgi:hypothetical protein